MYVATINTPGYSPWDDEPPTFGTPAEAWDYLADERRRQEEDAACDETCEYGPACEWGYTHDMTETVTELEKYAKWAASGLVCDFEAVGTVYGSTPGYHGDHDLGLAYSVSEVED